MLTITIRETSNTIRLIFFIISRLVLIGITNFKNIYEKTKENVIKYFDGKLDVIISDMAADTTGNKSLDSIRTNQLCAAVIYFAQKTLKPKGVLISKIFTKSL